MREIGTRPLALARVALGIVFLVRTTALSNLLPIPLAHVRGPLLGWPEPGFAFAWGGLVLPANVRIAVAVVRTIAALLFCFGVRARAAGIVAGVCGLLTLSQDPFAFIYTLHTLFLGTIVLALGDATSDLALVPDRPAGSGAASAASSASLLRVFVVSIYAWSAIAKMQGEWLSGRTLLALAEDSLFTPWAAALVVGHDALRVLGARSIVAVEVALAVGLLVPRTRRVALVVAFGLHAMFEVVARPDVMGWVMAALLLGLRRPRTCATTFTVRE